MSRKTVAGPPPVQRLRLTFAIEPRLRFISHLDLAKAWERTLRRAKVPVAYSHGFHPQPKIQFAAALPVGVSSECEILDVFMERAMSPEEFRKAVERALPPGLHLSVGAQRAAPVSTLPTEDSVAKVSSVEEVPLKSPALQSILVAAEYEVVLEEVPDVIVVSEAVEEFLARQEVLHEKRSKKGTKMVNIRPLVEALQVLPTSEDGKTRLWMRLSHRPGASVRATDVLDALGLSDYLALVIRKRLIFSDIPPHLP